MEIAMALVGWAGAALLLLAYGALTARRIGPTGWAYQALNIAGGICLLVNTAYHFAWPSAALNLFWVGIGALGLVRAKTSFPVTNGEAP